ncbi:hypothetical protein GJ744_009731 [Endocarpon pusillum]|uniref:Clr5 domain-containing protein n=1 Tax=Endocarpon pusillum TaxID=364733 RepID=A0A8H7E9C2_9EURO|nr:hypothetical protein GJ744_009731 [Endocarpon pusillum]
MMEWQAMPAAYPMQHEFQQGQAFEISGNDLNVFSQDAVLDGQIMGSFQENVDNLTLDGFPLVDNGASLDRTSNSFVESLDQAGLPDSTPRKASVLACRYPRPGISLAQPSYPTSRQWTDIKPIFTKLYIAEDRTLKEVQKLLERDYNFLASERMYKGRIKSWKLHKNLKKDEKVGLVRKIQQKRAVNNTLPNGRSILHRLERHCRENKAPPTALATNSLDNHPRARFNAGDNAAGGSTVLQSLFGPAIEPTRSIALYGSIRSVEVIMQNVEIYMNYYFIEGPGTRYYKKKFVMIASQHAVGQVLVDDEKAWQHVLHPQVVTDIIGEAVIDLRSGFIDLALRKMNEAFELVRRLLKEQTPHLLSCLCVLLIGWGQNTPNFAEKIYEYLVEMASIVLGSAHPLSIVIKLLGSLSDNAEKTYVLCALSKALATSFSTLENPEPLSFAHSWCLHVLRKLGSINAARDYLNAAYVGETAQKDSPYFLQKANLLYRQGKYLEAEIAYIKVLKLLKVYGQDMSGMEPAAESSSWCGQVGLSLLKLASTLDRTGKIDEARAMWRRVLDFASKFRGPNSTDYRNNGKAFDRFLTKHGYFEDREALRAECPWLLNRKKIPRKLL